MSKIANCIGGEDKILKDSGSCSKCARGYVKQKVPNGIDQCHQVYTCNNGLAKEHDKNVPGQRLGPDDTVPALKEHCISCNHNYDLKYIEAGPRTGTAVMCVAMTDEEIRRRGCPSKLKAAPKEHPYLKYDSDGNITDFNSEKIALSCLSGPNLPPLCLEDKVDGANKFWNQVKKGTPDYCLTLDDAVKGDGEKCDGFFNPDTLEHCGNTGDWDHLDIGVPGECSGTKKFCHGTLYCDEHEVTRRPAYKKCEDFHTYPSQCNLYYGEADPESGINPFCKAAEKGSDRYVSSTPCVSEADLDSGGHGCYDRCIAEAKKIHSTCTQYFEEKMRENNQDPYNDFTHETLKARLDHCNTCVLTNMRQAANEGVADGAVGNFCSDDAVRHMCEDNILKGITGEYCMFNEECQSQICTDYHLDPDGKVNPCQEKSVTKRGHRRHWQPYGYPDCDKPCMVMGENKCMTTGMCTPRG